MPLAVHVGEVFEGEHVGERWGAGADEGFAEEDGFEADFAEDIELVEVEHFEFALVRLRGGAFVGAHLEDAFLVGGGGARKVKRGEVFEGVEKGAVDAVKGWRVGRDSVEGLGGFLECGVVREIVGEGESLSADGAGSRR